MLWYSQRLRFLRECHSLAHMMFQIGRCFDKVKVWGSQGMSLAGTLDVPARSMLRHSQGLRFLRECRTPVDLMFQLGQCFKTVKAWGSSGNVAHRHTWCFSEVNASTQSKFEIPHGMSLAGHTWYCSEVNVSRKYVFRVLKCANERHSLRSLKLFLCRSIDLAETSSVLSSHIPCEPQTLSLSKRWPIWNIRCAGERHSLRNL